jgi:AcrR family transcriptional regulator
MVTTQDRSRREVLADQAADYALEYGLIGLSLRPLAAAIGTSDRMLLYHFASKDDLVATVLRVANDRSVAEVVALSPSADVRSGVLALWELFRSASQSACLRLYVEAAALGLLGREPWASVVGEANERWTAALADHLVACGAPRDRVRRAVALLDATVMGLHLDLPLDRDTPESQEVVSDLADAVAGIAAG